ncbi:MAG: ABC transporter ATP-binding protein [Anaerolineales bacterium]|nr:ABC transporter ATP-binding protein [Anaerolineales bacterium]
MNGLEVIEIEKSYTPDQPVLKGIRLSQQKGEVVALLGPSGCGKSTLLAIIAGLLTPDEGEVFWQGENLAGKPPHLRKFGLMFQDYALFPHMRVAANVAFGLRMQGASSEKISQTVSETLALVGLPGFEGRDVNTLSGGEQQRVALARALAPRPGLLMLDEPLGSLDRALRAQLLDDLRGIIRTTHQTTLYVTHDQEEAYSLADRVVVMHSGRVAQIGAPREIYLSPKSAFVARFVGLTNLVRGEAQGKQANTPLGLIPLKEDTSGPVEVLLRPDAARLAGEGLTLSGRVVEVAFMGETTQLQLEVPAHGKLTFEFPSSQELPAPGEEISVVLDLGDGCQSFLVD